MKVIPLQPRKKEIGSDLNSLLGMAVDLRDKLRKNESKTVPDFKIFISGKIMEILISNRMIERDSIFCGMYISGLLGSFFEFAPDHWVATDYMMEGCNNNDPLAVQQGANVCFLICSILPTRLGRCMKANDYRLFGIGLFKQYYQQTGNEIGFYMSNRFLEMSEVTKECINKI